MPTTLVTGGAGFVGLAVVEQLLAQGEHVAALDVVDLPPDARELFARLPGRLEAVHGSVLDAELLGATLKRLHPETVVHAATVTPDGAREQADPVTVNEVNFNGTLCLLEALRRQPARLLHLSTSGVYGPIQHRPGFTAPLIGEDVLPDPRTFYAVSKAAAEQTVLRYAELFGIEAVVARVGVAWGPWEYDTGARHVFSAPLQLLRLAQAGRPAVIGRESVKDWSYSRDIGRGVAALANAGAALRSRVFHVGGDAEWPVTDFARKLAAAFPGFAWTIAERPDDPAVNVTLSKASDRPGLDIGRLQRETGYRPAYGFDAACADYLDWAARTRCWR